MLLKERQIHGFNFERDIKNKYNIEDYSESYTSKWDGIYKGIPVSIKTKKRGCAIEMADFFRMSTIETQFILIVGFWEDNKDEIVEEHVLLINKDFWIKQFDINLVEEFKNIFDGISNSKDDDALWKIRREEATNKWKSTGSIINVHFKRDHKKQKRVQCSIKNKEFYNILVKYYSIDLTKDLFLNE